MTKPKQISDVRANRAGILWRVLLGLILLGAVAAIFTMWVFNRADLINANLASTRSFELMMAQQTESAKVAGLAVAEQTRTINEIANQQRQIATISADNTRIAGIAGAQNELGTAEAEATFAGATIEAIMANQATATATPLIPPTITPTSTPITPIWDKVQVISDSGANMRRGPGTNYGIITFLITGESLGWLATNEDGEWYNVQTEAGVKGWVHSSLVEPLALLEMPVAATQPATPVVFSTETPDEVSSDE